MSVSVLVTNKYNGNKQLAAYKRWLLRQDADIIIITEARGLGRLKGYRRVGARFGRHRRDCAIYIRRRYKRVKGGRLIRTLTRNVGGYAHARTLVRDTFRLNRLVTSAYAVHLNPGRKGKAAQENKRYLTRLAGIIASDNADLVLVGGDGNRRPDEPRDRDHPAALANAVGGKYVAAPGAIDFLIVKGGRVDALRTLGTPPGSDHPAYRYRVTPRRAR